MNFLFSSFKLNVTQKNMFPFDIQYHILFLLYDKDLLCNNTVRIFNIAVPLSKSFASSSSGSAVTAPHTHTHEWNY